MGAFPVKAPHEFIFQLVACLSDDPGESFPKIAGRKRIEPSEDQNGKEARLLSLAVQVQCGYLGRYSSLPRWN
jgi:hypothetical protein